MTLLTKASQRIEGFLYHKGYVLPEVRQMVRDQLLVNAAALVLALLWWLEPGFIDLAVGATLMTVNLMGLARFAQGLVRRHMAEAAREDAPVGTGGLVAKQLAWFYGRMILTGLVLVALFLFTEVSVFYLVAGLSTVVLTILFWGARQIGSNSKEA